MASVIHIRKKTHYFVLQVRTGVCITGILAEPRRKTQVRCGRKCLTDMKRVFSKAWFPTPKEIGRGHGLV